MNRLNYSNKKIPKIVMIHHKYRIKKRINKLKNFYNYLANNFFRKNLSKKIRNQIFNNKMLINIQKYKIIQKFSQSIVIQIL